MTNQQILEKAIAKAIENGYNGKLPVYYTKDGTRVAVTEPLIFNHNFATSGGHKASKSEKNKGLDTLETKLKLNPMRSANGTGEKNFEGGFPDTLVKNHHPTVKPLKLMSYLITLFSREGDVVLDPFVGSGTTCVAAKKLNREYIGIERETEYVEIAEARLIDKQASLL